MLENIKIKPLPDTLRLEDISDEEYFSEKYGGYISNSRLSLINPQQGGTPDKFINGLQANSKYSDSLLFGSAVHELTLQPESFFLCEVVDRPTAKLGNMADIIFNKKKGMQPSYEESTEASKKADYYVKSWNEDKYNKLLDNCNKYWRNRAIFESTITDDKIPIYLDEKNRIRLKNTLRSFDKNEEFTELLHPTGLLEDPVSKNERTILLNVEVTVPNSEPFILRLKSKLDNFTINNDEVVVNDVKTTGKPVEYFKYAVNRFHYTREMGMYSFMIRNCAKKFFNIETPKMSSNLLAVETFGDFNTLTYKLSNEELQKGFNEFKTLLRLVAYDKVKYGWTQL